MKKKLLSVFAAACALVFSACGAMGSGSSSASIGVKMIDIGLTDEEYAFAVAKGNDDLLAKVNGYIADIQADGRFDEICGHYYGDGTPVEVGNGIGGDDDTLTVATNAEFAPFEYLSDNGYCGIDMELAKGFAESLGKRLVIRNMLFEDVIDAVERGEADIAMSALSITEDRKEQIAFSDVYYQASQVLLVRADDRTFDLCSNRADVEKVLSGFSGNITIGGQEGTTARDYVTGSDDFPGLSCSFCGYASAAYAVDDMTAGYIDYVMTDAAPAKVLTAEVNSSIH